jgi:predicted AAA+ superfamily ATPase
VIEQMVLSGPWAARLGHRSICGVRFASGVNLLVGPNGSGKSTILAAIMALSSMHTEHERQEVLTHIQADTTSSLRVQYLDFDRHDTRVLARVTVGGNPTPHGVRFASHVETSQVLWAKLRDPYHKGMLVLLDEPDQGVDFWDGIDGLVDAMRNCPALQVIAAVGHPYLVLSEEFQVIELVPGYCRGMAERLRRVIPLPPPLPKPWWKLS